MKNLIFSIFFSVVLLLTSFEAKGMDPKVKMVATMAGYGVVSGVLLGTASMAFGAGGRWIAKGASLGLYAGLIFGGYVLVNYEMKKRNHGQESKENNNYYPESSGEYEEEEASNKIPDLESFKLQALEESSLRSRENDRVLVYLPLLSLRF